MCQIPKLDVAGSNPVSRSIFSITYKDSSPKNVPLIEVKRGSHLDSLLLERTATRNASHTDTLDGPLRRAPHSDRLRPGLSSALVRPCLFWESAENALLAPNHETSRLMHARRMSKRDAPPLSGASIFDRDMRVLSEGADKIGQFSRRPHIDTTRRAIPTLRRHSFRRLGGERDECVSGTRKQVRGCPDQKLLSEGPARERQNRTQRYAYGLGITGEAKCSSLMGATCTFSVGGLCAMQRDVWHLSFSPSGLHLRRCVANRNRRAYGRP